MDGIRKGKVLTILAVLHAQVATDITQFLLECQRLCSPHCSYFAWRAGLATMN
jgi:hypothetical protein